MNEENRKAGNSCKKINFGTGSSALTTESLNGERAGCEIEKKPVSQVCCLEITPTDGEMNIFKLIDGFELNDDLSIDEKIQPVLTNLMVMVKKRHRMLPNELDSAQCKLNCKRFLVNPFEKARSELAMNANGSGDDLPSNL
jgi:hypothetical protein